MSTFPTSSKGSRMDGTESVIKKLIIMETKNYMEKNFTIVGEYEATLIAGGKDPGVSKIARGIGVALGYVSKLAWKAIQAAQECIAEQGRNGEMIIHK